jgi:SAM-dependent methyltransferase
VGIEPDVDAVGVAAAMASAREAQRVQFIHGVGEALPFKLETFDLIVCHTVIEHVQSVPGVIAEMARVLSHRGVIHLEAPNYRWPREPHLGIWCVPMFGKRWMRVSAAIQGKHEHLYYLDHLQLVSPNWLERLFRANGLIWENRVRSKILRAASGEKDLVKEYQRMGTALRFVNALGVLPAIANVVIGTGLYPSVLYTVRRQESQP